MISWAKSLFKKYFSPSKISQMFFLFCEHPKTCELFDVEDKVSPHWRISDFFFQLFLSGIAISDFPTPVVPIFGILLRHFNLSHVLFRRILKPPFGPFPLSWQLHPRHPSHNISIIFPPYMSIPPQSCLSCFLSKPSRLCCPSDVRLLIPDLVHSCHS